MDMRRYIILLVLISGLSTFSFGQIIGKKAGYAIECISSGYIIYGVSELKQSAYLNDLAAQYYLASCFEYGIVYDKNLNEAFKMYRRAAERGLPDAMYKLSVFYKDGTGVSVDPGKSQAWLSRFEKKGAKFLLRELVSIYNEGLKHNENYALSPLNGNVVANTSGNNNTVNNITIIQAAPVQPTAPVHPTVRQEKPKPDIDRNIPSNPSNNEHSFALIIANENYQDVVNVPFALNDGEVFAEYCRKTLGMPASNVILVKDATYNNLRREISKLSQIADAYDGKAKVLFYYAGHGIPDEATKDAYLLPVDGYGTDVSTGFSLKSLYSALGRMPAAQVVVLLDACFSGAQRGDGMLASARGVAIKAKPNKAEGKVVVLSAAQGNETAYPFQEEGHGLFTYFLLKKLQESNGSVSLSDLVSYLKENVSRKSIVVNGKSQTPDVNPSASLGDSWKGWTLR